jgi:hypothetical protein
MNGSDFQRNKILGMDKTPVATSRLEKPVYASPAIQHVDRVCRGFSHATFWPSRKANISAQSPILLL